MTNPKFVVVLLIFSLFLRANGLLTENLGGTWYIRDDSNKYYDISGTVPGGIYTDLMDNKIIDDVFYGFNDVETRWVSYKNWTYSRVFLVSDIIDYANVRLIFKGLDTFSSIVLNDIEIGETDNMFLRYTFDVKQHLKEGENEISVKFLSPVEMSRKLYETQAESYVVPPSCVPDVYNGECHVNHIRKMQASFGWDWGPAFPSMGIWKGVYLEAFDDPIIEDVTVTYAMRNGRWECDTSTYFASSSEDIIEGILTISIDVEDGLHLEEQYEISVHRNADDEFVYKRQFHIPRTAVKLWQPNGYGDTVFYTFSVTFTNAQQQQVQDKQQKEIRIGFRSVELVQSSIQGNGLTFYFLVNDIPMFAKGSNTIPLSILPEKSYDPKLIRGLLQSAKDANMNMLRVWGGGMYESDEFYDIADEMGIFIWQDFMFACAMYPTGPEYLKLIRQEVRQQVRRLSRHPSVLLWAGNNENEWALRSNWYGTKQNFSLYQQDYVKLYVNTIRDEVFQNDECRSYLTSSPSNGPRSEEAGFVADDPNDRKYGDIHFYNNLNDAWDVENYPSPRFSSEYGFQSIPSISSLLTATNNTEDLKISSKFMEHRQHVHGGYILLKAMIARRMTLPAVNSENFHKAVIFYSQIYQAQAVKIQTEHYRASRNQLNKDGEGYTMGALYWQLNDVWVAPSWSGIDFTNTWKMLHYFAKDFFAPYLITGKYLASQDLLKVFIISDGSKNISNVSAVIKVYRWDSFEPLYTDIRQEDVISISAREMVSIELTPYLSEIGCGDESDSLLNCFVYLELFHANATYLSPNNYVFPCPLKDANFEKAMIHVDSVEKYIDGSYGINLISTHISLFVWLEAVQIAGRFSENGFLQITAQKTVLFYPENEITVEELVNNITVTHYLDENYL